MQVKGFNLESMLSYLLRLLIFVLPWQTIFIIHEQFLNGVKWEYGTIGFYGTEGLLWVSVWLFICWYFKQWRQRILNINIKQQIFFTWDRVFVIGCLLFVVYSFFSIVWSSDKAVALQQAFHILEAFLLFFMLYLGPLKPRQAMGWFVAGATVQSMLGIYQFLTQSTFAFKWLGLVSHSAWEAGTSVVASDIIGRWVRAYGAFSHANVFGGYLAIAIIFTLLLSVKLQTLNIKQQIFLVAALLIQSMGLFFTFSRSAWLVFVIVILLDCVKQRGTYTFTCRCGHATLRRYIVIDTYHISHIIYPIVLITILSTLFFPLVATRFSSESTSEGRSTSERVTGLQESWQLFKRHPLIGVGIGNYTAAAYALNPARPGWEYQPVHSGLALFSTELGALGLTLFALLLLSFITYHISRITYHLSPFISIYLLSFSPPFLTLLLLDHYLFSSYLGLLLSALYFALSLRLLNNRP